MVFQQCFIVKLLLFFYLFIYFYCNTHTQTNIKRLYLQKADKAYSFTYIGLTGNAIKTRFRNHSASFRDIKKKKKNVTELSKYFWSLKDYKTFNFH